jgi:hypothetical protein
MVTVLEPGLSKELQAAIDKADVASFTKLMDEHKVDASSFLFASARKIAYPLINRALSGDFTNKNYAEKLEIARMLMDRGANPDMIAPNGLSAMAHLLHIHQFLGVRNRVAYDVYMFTMLFVSELVIRYNADLNIALRSNDTLLDDVIYEYRQYYKKGITGMKDITFDIIEHMLERGAKCTSGRDPKFPELTRLLHRYQGNGSLYTAKALPEPPFDVMFDTEIAVKAWKAWNEKTSPAYEGLSALRQLQYRAYYHANWAFGEEEVKAIETLNSLFNEMEKDKRKAALSDLKKLTVPNKHLYDLKSGYEKELIDTKKEVLPMKPCYDDAVYRRLYGAFLENN